MKTFRPMLAAAAGLSDVEDALKRKGSLWVFPKIDGVRGVIRNGVMMSRSMKPIPNRHLQRQIDRLCLIYDLEGLDGELTTTLPYASDCYRRTTSDLMSEGGEPRWTFHVFDNVEVDGPFETRFLQHLPLVPGGSVEAVEPLVAATVSDVERHEAHFLEQGYEGLILRDPAAAYKHGRSTLKEAGMLKLKRFCDSEARVIDVVELERNENEATLDERGYTKRSQHKANLRPGGTMGALLVQDLIAGCVFKVGSGFDQADRDWWWANRDRAKGKLIKYKSFKIGVKDLPRHPTYIGIRDEIDL